MDFLMTESLKDGKWLHAPNDASFESLLTVFTYNFAQQILIVNIQVPHPTVLTNSRKNGSEKITKFTMTTSSEHFEWSMGDRLFNMRKMNKLIRTVDNPSANVYSKGNKFCDQVAFLQDSNIEDVFGCR